MNPNTTRVEYRVRPVTRFIVTRCMVDDAGKTGGSIQRGEFDNYENACVVADALSKSEQRDRARPPFPLPEGGWVVPLPTGADD